jgi:hypothetical protein
MSNKRFRVPEIVRYLFDGFRMLKDFARAPDCLRYNKDGRGLLLKDLSLLRGDFNNAYKRLSVKNERKPKKQKQQQQQNK